MLSDLNELSDRMEDHVTFQNLMPVKRFSLFNHDDIRKKIPHSEFQPAGSDSGAPQKFSGGSKDVQKVDKGKRRRSDSEERRAAEEEEEKRLQAAIAEREADLKAADSALVEQIRRRIERNEEERRDLLRRQAALHSSRPWVPAVTPAASSAAPVDPATPRVEPPAKRKRGRPRKSQEAPKITKPAVAKKIAPPRIRIFGTFVEWSGRGGRRVAGRVG